MPGLHPCPCTLHQHCVLFVSKILDYTDSSPVCLPSCIKSLGATVGHTEWSSLQDIVLPLHQQALSHAIDAAFHLDTAPDIRFKAISISTALQHAGDWLNVILSSALGLHILDHEYLVCLRCWLGLTCFLKMKNARSASHQMTLLVTTTLVAEATGIEHIDRIPSVMQFFSSCLCATEGAFMSYPPLPISTG